MLKTTQPIGKVHNKEVVYSEERKHHRHPLHSALINRTKQTLEVKACCKILVPMPVSKVSV